GVTAKLKNTTSLASAVTYDSMRKLKSLTYGNGLALSLSYDTANRTRSIIIPGIMNYAYFYDPVGNITAIIDGINPSASKTYTYDSLDRLASAAGPWGSLTWTYGFNGNRLAQKNGTSYNYKYEANRLMSITNGHTTNYGYDNAGNTTSDGTREFIYNQHNRLIKAIENEKVLGEYTYNGKGERAVKKTGPAAINSASSQNTVYHYDLAGRLIEETARDGKLLVDYVYLDGKPLAMIRKQGNSEETFWYHNDHLSTPKVLTDKLGKVVWNMELEPFGNEVQTKGTQGTYIRNVENNLRFPGQYVDAETGLHYNYFRNYNPKTGRYLEADPIGLGGGINPYLYVKWNPLSFADPTGTNPLTDLARYLWSKVIDLYLIPNGYTLAADLFKNSLQDYPGSINTVLAKSKIRASSEYQAKVKSIIANASNSTIPYTQSSIAWNGGDLFLAIHLAQFNYFGNKCSTDWKLKITISDIYDFDFNTRGYYKAGAMQILANIANNMAWSDQFYGVISPYFWSVDLVESSQ
ncbi:hypothetical protein EHM76_06285, partial [bacterium]